MASPGLFASSADTLVTARGFSIGNEVSCLTWGGPDARVRSLQLPYRLADLWVEVPGKDTIRTFTCRECYILKPEPFLGTARD